MRSRRGFTLIEVLVALGLLVVVASLALPVALTNTSSARAKTAERILKLSPNTARGEAQHRGLPVALVLLPSQDGQELRLGLVRQPDLDSDSAADQAADPDDVSTWPTVDEPTLLPPGTRLWDGQVEELEAFEAAAEEESERGNGSLLDRSFVEDDAEAAPENAFGEPADAVVLAWFLSDGSAMAGRATVVRLADGQVVRVRVEALTGRLEFTPAPELEGKDEDEPAEEEESSDLPDEPVVDEESPEGGGLDALGFDELEFEQIEFEDLSSRFGGGSDEPVEPGNSGADQPSQPDTSGSPDRTNPQPPQPR
ncbi:MAG: prepilin-type N-terminal cleavage/methylation domain-containing protein [Phycisphaera sp.]|nr:MAG: prepilin-type N-terminal cleavage/methylation domain-containing protein [Phycisphaera sp.]